MSGMRHARLPGPAGDAPFGLAPVCALVRTAYAYVNVMQSGQDIQDP